MVVVINWRGGGYIEGAVNEGNLVVGILLRYRSNYRKRRLVSCWIEGILSHVISCGNVMDKYSTVLTLIPQNPDLIPCFTIRPS